jgi:cysteine-rich repeat protein
VSRVSAVCCLFVAPLTLSACLSRRIDDLIAGLEVTEGATTGSSSGDSSTGGSSTGDASSTSSGTSGSGHAAADTSGDDDSSDTTTGPTDPGTSSGSGPTTDPPPDICGDGEISGEEECDDNNSVSNDGCTDCTADIRAFVSSVTHKAGDLTSLALADARCLQRAYDGGLAHPEGFRAWLSTSEVDARDRFDRGRRGRIVLINGLVVAAGWPELLAGALDNPLEVTELSTTYHGKVWTGTKSDGTAAESGHCLDWSSSSPTQYGYYGYSDEASFEWTLADQPDNPSPCIVTFSVYCIDSQ